MKKNRKYGFNAREEGRNYLNEVQLRFAGESRAPLSREVYPQFLGGKPIVFGAN